MDSRMCRGVRLSAAVLTLGAAVLWGAEGYLLEYETSGAYSGGTKMEGNLAHLFAAGMMKVSGATVFYERGNPYPNIEERVTVYHLGTGKKHMMAVDTGRWTTTEVAAEAAVLSDQRVKAEYTRSGDRGVLRFDVNLPDVLGGSVVYTVTYVFGKDAAKDATRLKAIQTPAAPDAVLFFLDNWRYAELAARRMGEDRYLVPERFQIVAERGGQKVMEVGARLRAAQALNLSEGDFRAR